MKQIVFVVEVLTVNKKKKKKKKKKYYCIQTLFYSNKDLFMNYSTST